MLSPLLLRIQADDSDARRALTTLTGVASQSASQIAAAYKPLATAFNPAISAAKEYEAAQKSAAVVAQRAARDAAAAYLKAGMDQKDSARSVLLTQQQAARDSVAAYRDAARQAVQAQRQADRDAVASARAAAQARKQIVSADSSIGRFNSFGNALDNNRSQMSGAQTVASGATQIGGGLLLAGGLGSAALFGSAVNAGRVNQVQSSFNRTLGNEEGGKLFEDLKAFDRRSPFSFEESMSAAQSALAQGVKGNEIIPLFDQLGDAVSKAGGGTVEFAAALRQIVQVKGKGQASGQDLNALAEGGKLPVKLVVGEVLGQARLKEVQSGDKPLTAKEFFDIVMPEIAKRSEGAMAGAMKELPGQLEALSSAAFVASAAFGKHLVPVVSLATTLLTRFADAFSSLPDWFQKGVVYVSALGIAVMVLGGGLLTLGGILAASYLSITAFGVAVGGTGLAAGGATAAIAGAGAALTTTGAAAATASTALGIGLVGALTALGVGAVAAAAIIAAIVWTKEATTKSDEEMEGKNASLRQKAVSKTGLWLAEKTAGMNIAGGDEAEQKSLMLSARLRRKAAADKNDQDPAGPIVATVPTTSNATTATAFSGGAGASGNIESLEDQLRSTSDKGEKKKINDQLFYARRSQRHSRQSEAQERKDKAIGDRNQRLALRNAGLDASGTAAMTNAMRDEQGEQISSGLELSGFRDQRDLKRRIRDIKAQTKAGNISEDDSQSRIQALQDAYAARDKARDADAKAQLSELEAQKVLAEGAARAAGQKGNQRETTLQIAAAKAKRVRDRGAAESDLLREEAADLFADSRNGASSATGSSLSNELRKAGVGASWGGPDSNSGAMFNPNGRGGGGGDSSFVGNNRALMAAGIARARGNAYAGRATYSADAIEARAGGREQVPVEFREAGRNNKGQTIYEVIGQIVVDTSGDRLSRSSAVMG